MAWPLSDVTTTALDQGTDTPQTARTHLLDLAQKFNLLRNHVSTFMQDVLAAANAAAARVLLDVPTRAGGNATGTWSINVTGNADTCSRTLAASGLAQGGGTLNGDRTITVPAASQAQAQAGTDNATAMTPLRTAQAIAALVPGPTTTSVMNAIAGMSPGQVGSFALLYGVSTNVGDLVAGSSLRAQGLNRQADNVSTIQNGSGPLQSGTWRALGQSSSSFGTVNLYVRVS